MRLAAPLAIMLALGASCLPAAAAGVLDRIKESGTVHFGYREDAAPLSYLDENNKPAGYSVLICDAVAVTLATQLGTEPLKIEWLPVTTTDRFEAVASGKIDLLCGAATITLTRRETVDFSLPTFVDGAAVLLPRDADPEFDALAGKNIGVRSGTSTEEVLRNTIEAKGMQATVVTFEAHDAALAALEAGEIDAYFGDQSILFGLFFASDLSESLVVSENTLTVEKHGLALPRGDTDFRLSVDRAVSELYHSGKIVEFFRTAFPGATPGLALQALFLLGPEMP
jgi:polar amino acid transport system substrate-binding protein/glutamate/aspartate transport system substrate-binding protein